MAIKLFDCGTVLDCIKDMLDEGFLPEPVEQIEKLSNMGEIEPKLGYSTGTIYYEGRIKIATVDELRRIEILYKIGARLFYVYPDERGIGTASLYNIDHARFVGAKK